MFIKNACLTLGALSLLAVSAAIAHDGLSRYKPVPQVSGVWQTQVSIVDCPTRMIVLAGPFSGLITFVSGGTIGEMGPALPGTTRGPGHGTWARVGRNTFAESLIFQRFDMSGILLGSQEIRATAVVADDSNSYQVKDGTFEVKDTQGNMLAKGCSAVTATRFQ
jgi:hypothetical protein